MVPQWMYDFGEWVARLMGRYPFETLAVLCVAIALMAAHSAWMMYKIRTKKW
jgi:hypothetical protein